MVAIPNQQSLVSTLTEGNKILHEAKMFADVKIKIQPIPLEDLRFVAFSDASFASVKVPDSHQGMLIMASHKNIAANQKLCSQSNSMAFEKDPKGCC